MPDHTIRCVGSPNDVMARLQAVASDWRDSTRPPELGIITATPVSFARGGGQSFQMGVQLAGAGFFDVAAVGVVTTDSSGTLIRYRMQVVPPLARVLLQIVTGLTVVSLTLAVWRRSAEGMLVLPVVLGLAMVVPGWLATHASEARSHRALHALLMRAAGGSPETV